MDVETHSAEFEASSVEQSSALVAVTAQTSEEKPGSLIGVSRRGHYAGNEAASSRRIRAAMPTLLKRWPGHLDRPKPTFDSIGFEAPSRQSPADLEGVDKRGMPLTAVAWEYQFLSSNKRHIWVYFFRAFVLWAYGRSILEAMRSPAHTHAVANYRMPDWFADTLAVIGRQQQTNIQWLATCRNHSQADLEFDVQGLAEFLQYTEQSIRGCQFVNNAWTLRLRNVRGAMLFEVLNVERLGKKEFAPAHEHVARIRFEKMLITLLVTPNTYMEAVKDQDLMVADEFVPKACSRERATMISMEELVAEMAANGITVELVDDAWVFTCDWVKEVAETSPLPTGWTVSEANELLARSNNVPDPSGFDDVNTLWPRHPSLPWSSKAEQILLYEVSGWHSPYTTGMKREAKSQIQASEAQVSQEVSPALLKRMASTMVVKRVHAPVISLPVASTSRLPSVPVSDSAMELDIHTGTDPDAGEDHTMLQYDEALREEGPAPM
ncbi:hypothetical protein DFH09DRAFT_1092788 [Mycena vulgaris]|nr:hypothetical protein DFH09DRAFT_1092788 [Mycena vulgaris]